MFNNEQLNNAIQLSSSTRPYAQYRLHTHTRHHRASFKWIFDFSSDFFFSFRSVHSYRYHYFPVCYVPLFLPIIRVVLLWYEHILYSCTKRLILHERYKIPYYSRKTNRNFDGNIEMTRSNTKMQSIFAHLKQEKEANPVFFATRSFVYRIGINDKAISIASNNLKIDHWQFGMFFLLGPIEGWRAYSAHWQMARFNGTLSIYETAVDQILMAMYRIWYEYYNTNAINWNNLATNLFFPSGDFFLQCGWKPYLMLPCLSERYKKPE